MQYNRSGKLFCHFDSAVRVSLSMVFEGETHFWRGVTGSYVFPMNKRGCDVLPAMRPRYC